ncbi:helix-turn-helix domain-containing protein [Shewanella insulae]|uniref:helix-turn-helix domain-containing protein n=1 Tax=Shewanella insulae TaxID=2681496 RepID=UPI001EFDE794|nr:helix-turn-helix transcriptional regulator [Shewanella insulae]MCG9755028.1 helix-turn-helix domain-containing protein [Shewanella insulae]
MALTDFGKALRKARIDIDYTLRTMAEELETSPAYLSCLETGSKKISKSWIDKINSFLRNKGVEVDELELEVLANISNQSVPLDGLSQQHKMLVAGFAHSPFTPSQLKKFAKLLEEVSEGNK